MHLVKESAAVTGNGVNVTIERRKGMVLSYENGQKINDEIRSTAGSALDACCSGNDIYDPSFGGKRF